MKIQVLMSTYNGEKFFNEQLESILNQEGVDLSVLIRDDGSDGKFINILKSAEKSNENVRVIYGENLGVTRSFFELVNQSDEVDYYAFSDQDDVWMTNKLKTAASKLNDQEPALYVGNYKLVDQNLNAVEVSNDIDREINFGKTLVENLALGCTIVFNKNLRNAFCDFTPTNAIIHDWYFYMFAQAIGSVYVDTIPTMYYRQHDNNVIGNKKQGVKQVINKLKALDKWAIDNRLQITHIRTNYFERIKQENLEIMDDYLSVSSKGLRDRLKYIISRKVKRKSKVEDLILVLLIFCKKV